MYLLCITLALFTAQASRVDIGSLRGESTFMGTENCEKIFKLKKCPENVKFITMIGMQGHSQGRNMGIRI